MLTRNQINISSGGSTLLRLAIILSLAWSLSITGALAEAPVVELSAASIRVKDLPPLFYLEVSQDAAGREQRRFSPLDVSSCKRGALVSLPSQRPIQIYTKHSNTEGSNPMKPFLDVPANATATRLLLVFYLDEQGRTKTTFLDDSIDAHPPGTVRMVNFSSQRIAFTVGGEPILVPPDGDAVARRAADADNRFTFKYFAETKRGKTYESPEKNLAFPKPDSRILFLYSAAPKFSPTTDPEESPAIVGYSPVLQRMQDRVTPRMLAGDINNFSSSP